MPTIDEVLVFLKEWKTRKQVEEHFGWSNTTSFNWIRNLKKRGLIEEWKVRESGRVGRIWYYRAKN